MCYMLHSKQETTVTLSVHDIVNGGGGERGGVDDTCTCIRLPAIISRASRKRF